MSTGNIPLAPAIPNQLITSALWNNEFANVQALTTPTGINGYSDTDPTMQLQTNPYPGSVTSHATALAGELERIRYQLAQILGTDYWFKPAAADLTSVGNVVVPLGGVIDYPVVTAPSASWHLADGTAISRATYATLFALIGTTFGVGDGTTTFNLPDYRDRMSIGAGNLYAVAAVGGATSINLTHSHTVNSHTHDLANHTHDLANHTHTGPSHTHTLSFSGGAVLASGTNVQLQSQTTSASGTGVTGAPSNNTSGIPSPNTSGAATPGTNTQLSAAQNILNPYIGMYKIIRVL